MFAARAVTNTPLKRLTGIGAGRRAIDIIEGVSVPALPHEMWALMSDYSVFEHLMSDVSSRIQVELNYNPVAGAIGHVVGVLFGADPRHKLTEDMHRLKSYIEPGNSPPTPNTEPVAAGLQPVIHGRPTWPASGSDRAYRWRNLFEQFDRRCAVVRRDSGCR